jgi:hypothetical protein
MTLVVAILLFLANDTSYAEARALQRTAIAHLTPETAYLHLKAARLAGSRYQIRPELLLAIARHESNYNITTQTPEPGHRVSCGVMTPVPKRRCTPSDLSLYGGYYAGAAHLRVWMNHCNGSEICALLSYAGGQGLYRVCAIRGQWPTRHGTNACDLAYQLRAEASRIQQALWAVRRNFEARDRERNNVDMLR